MRIAPVLIAIAIIALTATSAFADDCGFRTHTQNEWGSSSNGTNAAAYRTRHFAAAFPNGVRIGLPEGNSALFTTSLKVQTYLPSIGEPLVLAGNTTDTIEPVGGSLGGETLALALNIAFDLENESFSPGNTSLKDATITEGACAGKQVNTLLSDANNALGGITAERDLLTIVSCLAQVNANISILSCKSSLQTDQTVGNTTTDQTVGNTSTGIPISPNTTMNQTNTTIPGTNATISNTIVTNSTNTALPPTNNATNDTNITNNNTPSAVLRTARWYPKGTHYVFFCNATGMTPRSYSWWFGDGEKLLRIRNDNVYHIFRRTGNYTVTCTAHGNETDMTARMTVKARQTKDS